MGEVALRAEPAVLVDREAQASLVGEIGERARAGDVEGERLLREHVLPRLERASDQLDAHARMRRDIHDVDAGMREQRVDAGKISPTSCRSCAAAIAAGSMSCTPTTRTPNFR